ncbi:hypothetical protein CSUI_008591 [Cystoisospora suis]|uniref:Transmembrane protein n=1 Tax=Cystoisospora suis TaxID=483139 RepID=A0A2C6KMG7_9APIC|nr:hypothetical protein CSUI_008591 [Cystoisospora suis]
MWFFGFLGVTMGYPQNDTQSGAGEWNGMGPHFHTSSDTTRAVEQENELLERRPSSEYRVARSKARSRVTLGRRQSSTRLGVPTSLLGVAALGLLLVSLVTLRLLTCFKALAVSKVTQPRGYSSGVTSRMLAWGESDDDVPLLGSLDDEGHQSPSAENPSTSRYPTPGAFSSPAVCPESWINVISEEPEVPKPAPRTAEETDERLDVDFLVKVFYLVAVVLVLAGIVLVLAAPVVSDRSLVADGYILGGLGTAINLTVSAVLIVSWVLKRRGKAGPRRRSSSPWNGDSRDIL